MNADYIFEKLSVFDIYSIIIPGFMILLGVYSLVPDIMIDFIRNVNNIWITIITVICVSYYIGIILSKIISLIMVLNFNDVMKKIFFLLLILLMILINVGTYFLCCFNTIFNFILVFDSVSIFLIFYYSKYRKKEEDLKSNRSKILLDICYRYLQKAFPNLKSIYGEELSENIVYEILNIMYPLIELDHKYQTTIKKYTTFLSLYKNMIIVCLFWSGIFSYYFIFAETNVNYLYFIGFIFSLNGCFVMIKSYNSYQRIVNRISLMFLIDYIENNKK